jgi:hypothetical protein
MAWALIDILSGPNAPALASREWFAERLGVTESGAAKALGALTKAHQGKGLVPDSPAWATSWHRGKSLTAAREVVKGVPWVDVPEWTIGKHGPLVPHQSWRLYVVVLHKVHPVTGVCSLSRKELAQLLRVRSDSMTKLMAPLIEHGLVVVSGGQKTGKATRIVPVLKPGLEGKAEALNVLYAAAADQLELDLPGGVDNPAEDVDADVDNSADCVDNQGKPDASTGTSPPPDPGTSPHPDPGTCKGGPPYESRSRKSRRRSPRDSAAARRAGHNGEHDHGSLRIAGRRPWCGICLHPQQRYEIDRETGLSTGQRCSRCNPDIDDREVA